MRNKLSITLRNVPFEDPEQMAIVRAYFLQAADEIDRLEGVIEGMKSARAVSLNIKTVPGCICPAGAEQSCRGLACPRRGFNVPMTVRLDRERT